MTSPSRFPRNDLQVKVFKCRSVSDSIVYMYVVEEDLTECSAAEEVKVPLLVKIIYARLVVSFFCCSLRSSLTCLYAGIHSH